jgi:hypothetical protein
MIETSDFDQLVQMPKSRQAQRARQAPAADPLQMQRAVI